MAHRLAAMLFRATMALFCLHACTCAHRHPPSARNTPPQVEVLAQPSPQPPVRGSAPETLRKAVEEASKTPATEAQLEAKPLSTAAGQVAVAPQHFAEVSFEDEAPAYPAVALADDGSLGLPTPVEGGPACLTAFHTALKATASGEGITRLAFFGASHVAADWFTGHLRRKLQRRFGDAGHGFILPARPWGSYRHLDVYTQSDRKAWQADKIYVGDVDMKPLGLMGTYVETAEATVASLGTVRRGKIGRSASRFELYYGTGPEGGDFEVTLNGKSLAKLSTRNEAPSFGIWQHEGTDGAARLSLETLGTGTVRFYGAVLERGDQGVVLDTLGINGSRARYQLLWESAVFEALLAQRAPQLVVLAYGTNESGDDLPIPRYEAQLRAVIGRVQAVTPKASCLLVGPTDRPLRTDAGYYEDRPRTLAVVGAQRKIAAEMGCGFFDLVAFQGGPLSMPTWSAIKPPMAAPDHIHLTRRGYERLGDRLYEALLAGSGLEETPGASSD